MPGWKTILPYSLWPLAAPVSQALSRWLHAKVSLETGPFPVHLAVFLLSDRHSELPPSEIKNFLTQAHQRWGPPFWEALCLWGTRNVYPEPTAQWIAQQLTFQHPGKTLLSQQTSLWEQLTPASLALAQRLSAFESPHVEDVQVEIRILIHRLSPDTEDGRIAGALTSLSELWKKSFHPSIADAMVTLGNQQPILLATPRQSIEERVGKILTLDDPGILSLALRAPWPPTAAGIRRRLQQLVRCAPDPRISRTVLELLHNNPLGGDAANSIRVLGMEVLTAQKDSDTAHRLADPEVREDWLLSVDGRRMSWGSACASLPRSQPLTEVEQQELKMFCLPDGVDKREQLLKEAIYAAPYESAPRRVYADFLMEKNDPRGEFIQLQCSGRGLTRAAKLLKKHSPEWLSELPGLDVSSAVFENGFVARAKTRAHLPSIQLLAAPPWGTVHTLGTSVLDEAIATQLCEFSSMRALHTLWSEVWLGSELPPALGRLSQISATFFKDTAPSFAGVRTQSLYLSPRCSLKGSFLQGSAITTLGIETASSINQPAEVLTEIRKSLPDHPLQTLILSGLGMRPLHAPQGWVFTFTGPELTQVAVEYRTLRLMNPERVLAPFLPLFRDQSLTFSLASNSRPEVQDAFARACS